MHMPFARLLALFLLACGSMSSLRAADAAQNMAADDSSAHLRQYAQGIANDPSVEVARELELDMPVMCREWHVWWGAPWGKEASLPGYFHWKGFRYYGTFDHETNIEDTVPGSAWRRYLNCVGYPLLGPYDSGQSDIIRWQLQTAKNAGLECLHLHLWPSLWDAGTDFTPVHIADKAFDIAAELNFPIAFHDEIMFRRPNITKAQLPDNTIARLTQFLKRYGQHPGFYKIDGMPYYYMQNWSKWISAADLQRVVTAVEKEVGPVYWVVEMDPGPEYLAIPEIKAFCGSHTDSFLHTAPNFGKPPHDWDQMAETMTASVNRIRAAGKKVGINLKTRFNNTHDRSTRGHGIIPAEDGKYFIESLALAKSLKPDFLVIAQWNDFEECAFVEPAWDFDGFNGDPYRWCRMIAASVGKTFAPAPLPARENLDPFIRAKLFPEPALGDMGPVMHGQTLTAKTLSWNWGEGGRDAASLRIVQSQLAVWTPDDVAYQGQALRLGNYSLSGQEVTLEKDKELRFYAPGLAQNPLTTMWLGVEAELPGGTNVMIRYRTAQENYRNDSTWRESAVSNSSGHKLPAGENRWVYWMPLYGARMTGMEGDLVVRLQGKKEKSTIHRVFLWHPAMAENSRDIKPDKQTAALPDTVNPADPFVMCGYDTLGNPGLPRLFVQGKSTGGKRIPMTDLKAGKTVLDPYEFDEKAGKPGDAETE